MPPTVQTGSREDRERRSRGTGERMLVLNTLICLDFLLIWNAVWAIIDVLYSIFTHHFNDSAYISLFAPLDVKETQGERVYTS